MPPTDNRRGIAAMLAASCFFITNDTLLKVAATGYPASQLMALRGLFAVSVSLAIVVALGQLGQVRSVLRPAVLTRAGLEAAVAFLFITSLTHLPLANITAITQATPIIMTLLSVLLGIERVGWRRWSAILVGFLGVLLVVKPSPAGFDVYALLVLGAATAVAVRDLVTRSIGPEVPSTVIALTTTSVVTLAGCALALTEPWQPFTFGPSLLVAIAGIVVTLGNLAIIMAFRGTDVSVVSPFRYSIILLALLSGLFVFGELPDLWAGLGILLIVGSGVYTIHREQARLREARRIEALAAVRQAA
jgi:drug/metabolite transporter (DMT)-like permease